MKLHKKRTAEQGMLNLECRIAESLSHRGVGLMPYGPEAEAQTLQPLRARGFAQSSL